MKLLKNSIMMRGDSLYCPLSLSLDSYGNCLTDCHHCYFRNLNHVWGMELKPADVELLEKKLIAGLKNKKPQSSLAWALSHQKTIRWGNKTDPFQECEREYKVAKRIFNLLHRLNWTYVIQTRFTHVLMDYEKYMIKSHEKKLITVMPVMSPGLERDWEILEKKLTTPPMDRLKHGKYLMDLGVNVGFNGEPFIPGFHEISEFENTLKLLKHYKIPSYNTYNFHFNAYVAKRLHAIGIDIEKIWFYNQDREWKKILPQLLDLSKKYGIKLGNPDFVNTGVKWVEPANTCCGVDVPNPCTFNSHYFKKFKQNGYSDEKIIERAWDGTGDYETGLSIVTGTCKKMYNLKDCGL